MSEVKTISAILLALLLGACGGPMQGSKLQEYEKITYTPNDADPAHRIGLDPSGQPYSRYAGKAAGTNYEVSWIPPQYWVTLVYTKELRGGEVMSVPTIEFDKTYVPMWGNEFETEDWTQNGVLDCSPDPRKSHEGSFQIRMSYKVNGVATSVVTPPIAIAHGQVPKYPASAPDGTVKLEGLVTDGSIKDLTIEIGSTIERKFSGTCYLDNPDMPSKPLVRSTFNARIKKIVVPFAANK